MAISKVNYANKGKSLETLINLSNTQYRQKGIALIQKIATPWTVIRRGEQIVSAFPAEKSTVDYIGLQNGVPIAFDAKQCHNKTSFPLSRVEPHQIAFLQRWEQEKGDAFFLIEMTSLGKIYRVPLAEITKERERKSIPIAEIASFDEVKSAGGIALDYLGAYSK